MKKILITGANGLLGHKLVQLFSNLPGYEVHASSRGQCRVEETGKFYYHPADLSDPEALPQLLGQLQPHSIIHTAAITQPDVCEQDPASADLINIHATRALARAAARQDIFLIHLSTDFIFDGENGPYDEEAQPGPVNYYGQSKWEAEKAVQASGGRHAIVRTVLVYGITPGMSRSNIILWVKSNLEQGKAIRVVNDQLRTPTLAEDLAMGCLLIEQQQATGIFNIAGKESLTPYQMALQTAAFFGLDAALISPTHAGEFKEIARRPLRTGCMIDKAQRLLAYEPRSFAEGLALMQQQMRGAGQG